MFELPDREALLANALKPDAKFCLRIDIDTNR